MYLYMNIVCPHLYILLQVELQNHYKIIVGQAAVQPKNYQFKRKFNLIVKYIDNIHF